MSRDRAVRATRTWLGWDAGGGRKECAIQMPPISMGCTWWCVLAMPCARRWPCSLAGLSALPSSSAEGKNSTELVTSRRGRICFAATGKGEAVPDGSWAELLREKALLRWRTGELDGGVALLVVVVRPINFKLN